MGGLIANEWMKLGCRKLTRILLVLLAAISIGTAVLGKVNSPPSGDWRAATEQLVRQYEERLSITELSPVLRADASNKLAIAEYRLSQDIPPLPGNPWSALLASSGLVEMVMVLAIVIAADMVAGEYASGTMKLLLIRPRSRTEIWFSKYIAITLFAAAMLVMTVVCGYAANALLYGIGNIHAADLFLDGNGQVIRENVMMQVVKMYGLSIIPVIGYVTLALAVSTILRSSNLAVGISLFLMITGNSMVEATAKVEWLKFLPFANSDISLYIFSLPPRPGMTLGFSISVLLIYMVILVLISWTVFTKRDVSI
jgi:ABC-2 type transport system permease protein